MIDEKTIVKVTELSKQFSGAQGQVALHDVSVDVRRGEVLCVIGPSGGGKTTLLRSLAGLELPDAGEVETAASSIAMVFQGAQLWPQKSVLENIVLPQISVQRVSRATAEARALELLGRFSMQEFAEAYPELLSGGQQQRVAIIRALAMEPEVLLLDEVTSALDPELVLAVQQMISILAAEGQTMVIVTHDMQFAADVADRVLFLEHGRALQCASKEAFFHQQQNPRILDFLKRHTVHESIHVYRGYESFQAYQMQLLKRLPVGAVVRVATGVGDRWYECMGDRYAEYELLRVSKQVVWKMVLREESVMDTDLQSRLPELTKLRYVATEHQHAGNYNVVEDTILIQTFYPEPAIIEIRNPVLAKSYEQNFEMLWDAARVDV